MLPQADDLETMPGKKAVPRIIVHVDMDSFYASVEIRHRPDLAGKPVIIGADPKGGSERGVVLTCSYEARKFGVHSALAVTRAFELCPEAIFLPPRHELYQQTSERVMDILEGYADRFQQVSIDEAYLDITSCGSYTAATDIAKKIKQDIFEREHLTCSIGVAPGKSMAKIASDLEKPDGLVVVTPERAREFLSPLPVERIPGIGPKSAASLRAMGIRTIGNLAETDVQELMRVFGRAAIAVRNVARGIDDDEVMESGSTKSLSREQTFCPDSEDPEEVMNTLFSLSDELCTELSGDKAYARTVTVKVRYPDFPR